MLSRIQGGAASYAGVIADPALRTSVGHRLLANAATREANILAYNDVFILIGSIAILTMIWIFIRSLWLWYTTRTVSAVATLDSSRGAPAQ
ncbi:hypothetical protein D3C77_674330 [compost metagenome]